MVRTDRATKNRPPGKFYRRGLWASIVLTVILSVGYMQLANAQSNDTPVPLNLPTQTLVATLGDSPTVTSGVTPVVLSSQSAPVSVEAQDSVVGTNVRQFPSADTATQIIGRILAGHHYQVIGKSGDWIEIYYDKPVPNTPGWVYSKIVNVTGSLDSIPQVDPNTVPTANPQDIANQQSATFYAKTPGGVGSATALQLSATGVSVLQTTATAEPTAGGPLATFTFPPPFVEATLMPSNTVSRPTGSIPPIVPILGFAAVGILGLLVSSARRS